MLLPKPSAEESGISLNAAPKTYYPGAVVVYPGVYRVQHSMDHHPDTETYIEAGLFLPHCNVLGCHVSFRFVKRIAFESHITQKHHYGG